MQLLLWYSLDGKILWSFSNTNLLKIQTSQSLFSNGLWTSWGQLSFQLRSLVAVVSSTRQLEDLPA